MPSSPSPPLSTDDVLAAEVRIARDHLATIAEGLADQAAQSAEASSAVAAMPGTPAVAIPLFLHDAARLDSRAAAYRAAIEWLRGRAE